MLIGPLDLGEPSYVINGLMAPAVSDVSRVALLPIACEVVINFVDAKQLLDVNVKRSTESFPLVVLNRRLWIKVSQPTYPEAVQCSGSGEERSRNQPADVTQE